MSDTPQKHTIALIGLGTIGLSFAALHLRFSRADLRLYDVRDDLEQHISSLLPVYLRADNDNSLSVESLISSGRLTLCSSIKDACADATIVQEQGPDSVAFKKSNWAQVVKHAPPSAHLWSSTSGICASKQVEDLEHEEDKSRVLVVHPFNPPHIMPLLEIVPSPHTEPGRIQFAVDYFTHLGSGHRPVVIKKETQGFVGNRLAFALFREACHLVANDVVSAQDIDTIMESSLGPRWAAAGPFKTYNSAGGAGGIGAFMHHLAPTIEACWDDAGAVSFRSTSTMGQRTKSDGTEQDEDWPSKVSRQTDEAYGRPDAASLARRDEDLKRIIDAQPKRH
jgi:3-hydroxyacyl-CoA dehydrogenase